jgi:superfamily II DNA or RNA helicase
MRSKQRQAAADQLESIQDDQERLVLATGRFIGEGFDDSRLDTLFLTMPVSWRGTLVQYVGRLHRRHGGKTEVRIIDYVDREIPMLARMFEKRLRGYRAMGYVPDEDAEARYEDDLDHVIEYEDKEPESRRSDFN